MLEHAEKAWIEAVFMQQQLVLGMDEVYLWLETRTVPPSPHALSSCLEHGHKKLLAEI